MNNSMLRNLYKANTQYAFDYCILIILDHL